MLRPGGAFAFNSAFFEGATSPDLEPYYRRWILRAHRILRSEYGLVPKKAKRVEARKQLSRHQYEEILEEHGFRLRWSAVHEIEIPVEAWLDICSYKDFIAGALGDVPLEQASTSLRQAARQVFDEIEPKQLRRNWLQIVAVRNN